MNTSKVYHDSDGNECSIWQMVKREPTWAADRIQAGEDAIERIAALESDLATARKREMRWIPVSERLPERGTSVLLRRFIRMEA